MGACPVGTSVENAEGRIVAGAGVANVAGKVAETDMEDVLYTSWKWKGKLGTKQVVFHLQVSEWEGMCICGWNSVRDRKTIQRIIC